MSRPLSAHIAHICDTTDAPARAKLTSAYAHHSPHAGITPSFFSIVPALTSVEVGINACELITNTQRPDRLVLAGNCAPPDRPQGTKDNIRNDFFCAVIANGITYCGTNNGYEFSYVKPLIKSFYRLTNTNHLHSQFRSLEVLPRHALLFNDPEKRNDLITKGYLDPVEDFNSAIPDVPDITHVFQVDNFKNVKLYLSQEDRRSFLERRPPEGALYFTFKRAAFQAAVTKTFFEVPLGSNVFSSTSSSTLADGRAVPMIATIRKSPATTMPAFGRVLPRVGEEVLLTSRKPSLRARLLRSAPVLE